MPDAITCPAGTTGDTGTCAVWDETQGSMSNTDSNRINRIDTLKDLEDFAPLALMLNVGASSRDANGFITLPDGVSMTLLAKGFGINIFNAKWENGLEYIHQAAVGRVQVENSRTLHLVELVAGVRSDPLTAQQIKDLFGTENIANLIFEGTTPSQMSCVQDSSACYLEYSLHSGGEIINSEKIYMNILPIKHYYDHYTVGNGGANSNPSSNVPNFRPGPVEYITRQVEDFEYVDIFSQDPDTTENKDYILFVHGWRMQLPEKFSFAETAFKRLYWSGNKNQFAIFTWPTGWFEKPPHIYDLFDDAIINEDDLQFYLDGNEQNYSDSEAVARLSGYLLKNTLSTFKSNIPAGRIPIDKLRVFAHSMGNVVVSEALRNAESAPLIDTYIPLNAATVGSAYSRNEVMIHHLIKGCTDGPANTPNPEKAWRCYNLNGLDNEYDMPPNYYSYDIPALHGPTKPTLETQAALASTTNVREETWGATYYSTIGASAANIVNFHNRQDIALEGWEFGQLTKPDFLGGDTWNYDFNYTCVSDVFLGCALDFSPDFSNQDLVTDKYQRAGNVINWNNSVPIGAINADILGHIIPTRTNALGQSSTMAAGSIISGEYDLFRDQGYGHSNFDHSAAFYNSYSERCGTWRKMLESMEIAPYENLICEPVPRP